MHKFMIGSENINDIAIVTKVDYPLFSYTNIYTERASRPPIYRKRQEEKRIIQVELLLKDICKDPIELQKEVEALIETKFKTDEPVWIEIDDRYFYGLLESVSSVEMYRGILTLDFADLLGNFYSEEKSTSVSTSFSLTTNTVKNSSVIMFDLTPTRTGVTVQVGVDKLIINNTNNNNMLIDFERKTIKQNGIDVERDINSKWGTLKKLNTIQVTNATGVIKYREVLA